jgi:hypothetical protein
MYVMAIMLQAYKYSAGSLLSFGGYYGKLANSVRAVILTQALVMGTPVGGLTSGSVVEDALASSTTVLELLGAQRLSRTLQETECQYSA